MATAVNGLEVARFGGLRTDNECSPHEVVARERVYTLRRYYPDAASESRAPVLLVPPLMMTSGVWDVSPESSAVTMLHEQEIDPWVVDYGDPGREPGGGERNVTDHVLAVVDAAERVRRITGQDVHLGGYSQGGLFCYQAAAYRSCEGIASIFTLGTPVKEPPLPGTGSLPADLVMEVARLEALVLGRTGVPGWLVGRAFRLANPTKSLRSQVNFLRDLHDRDALLSKERQRRFLAREGWVGWPGPAITELIETLSHGRYMRGGLVFGDRTVGLADVTCPVLLFIGEADNFGPAPYVRTIVHAAPSADVYESVLPVGHFGLPVGKQAAKRTWPGVGAWVRWLAEEGPLPDDIHPVRADVADDEVALSEPRGRSASLAYGVGLAAEAALATPGRVARAGKQVAGTTLELSREAVAQVPRLVRLERMGPSTRISWGSLIDDAARRDPEGVSFLFEDRAHTKAASNRRTDNVVRGLISLGVRKGEHIGVLMHPRPSAVVSVAALNRLGAVAVMLRPGGPTADEAALGQVTRVVADPAHASVAAEAGLEVFVLGGGGGPRRVPPGTVDMEQIDPDAVELPGWYTPNPGRARDLAFILFTGPAEATRADRITNGRWARSAFGAASAASLTPSDTVYSVNPLHHPSGLLLATAASVAGGCRLAMANRFDPDTFWSEVRRYGVTVVPYTWTMLRELIDAPPHPEERHHPIRLFVGSGMPRNLWQRVLERFSPAAVLELYASTRTDAIIGNVSGRKVGALGRPLPGMPRVRVAAYDRAADRLETGDDGLAIRCAAGETGMLLVESGASADSRDIPLRGVFKPDDTWIATGDLFKQDSDGDLWLVDVTTELIDTLHGTVSPRAVEEALGELDAVDLAACYGIERPDDGATVALAALTLRPNRTLKTAEISDALEEVDANARPDLVYVLGEMPVTSWFRPSLTQLRALGHRPDAPRGAWRRDGRTGRYRAIRQQETAEAIA